MKMNCSAFTKSTLSIEGAARPMGTYKGRAGARHSFQQGHRINAQSS